MRRILDWISEHPELEVKIVALPSNLLRITLKHYVDEVEYVLNREHLELLDLDFDYSLLTADLLNRMHNELMGYDEKGVE